MRNKTSSENENNDKNIKNKKKEKTHIIENHWWVWPIKIFFLAMALSLLFSIASELLMSRAGIIISIVCVLFFVSVSVVTDMIGVAVAACTPEPFKAMASRKVRGAKEALFLVKNADRVASLCADVLGDVCGILSGAGGTTILYHIVTDSSSGAFEIVMASVVSAVIAGLTIFGKAIFKKYSMENCTKVILTLGKFLSLFTRNKKDKKKKNRVEQSSVNTTIKITKLDDKSLDEKDKLKQINIDDNKFDIDNNKQK